MDTTRVLLLCCYLLAGGSGAPLVGDLTSATSYLSRYGYLKENSYTGSAALMSQDTLVAALKDFQAFAGLNVTGELDNDTVKMMATPRCGVEDMDPNNDDTHVRTKRYDIHGSRWHSRNITYRVSKYSQRLTREQVDHEIARALQVWSNHTSLVFTKWPGGDAEVHIDIRFETGDHGDWDKFDGPSGTLAHAYFPLYGGDVHFDDDEDWRVGNDDGGTNLFQIAVHELGHSLGLHHSEVAQAVMGPFYKNYSGSFDLHEDDIEGITYLYGNTWTAISENTSLCDDISRYTIFTDKKGNINVLRGDLVFRLNENGVVSGYPRFISDVWPGLPGDIDAAFTYHTGKTYFFKGKFYWKYLQGTMDGKFPKRISDGFIGIPDDIDAAFQWSGNNKIYFFKGDKFWKYDPYNSPPVSRRYPKSISNWQGIPNHLDAAIVYSGYSYFFKGQDYYRFNDEDFAVDEGRPPFPRDVSSWWFGCNMISD
ncbi:matrix metalloproteinase-16 [Anabrus simplex]|uniref:matrix metalloproteinase-16 n=1 Tax=Anabrus simplex TaxID=316456 RepID=UPI0035A34E97